MNLAQTNFRALMASMRSMHRVPLSHRILDRYGVPMELAHDPLVSGRSTPKECYANSTRRALNQPRKYLYCEGVACSPTLGMPIDHAWLLREDGKVIDPTWPHADATYFGIPFHEDDVLSFALDTEVYGILPSVYMWGRTLKIEESLRLLVDTAKSGLTCAAGGYSLAAPSLSEVSATVRIPDGSMDTQDAYRKVQDCFVLDSVVVEGDAPELQCRVEGHDADYLQKAVIDCLQSKPITFAM